MACHCNGLLDSWRHILSATSEDVVPGFLVACLLLSLFRSVSNNRYVCFVQCLPVAMFVWLSVYQSLCLFGSVSTSRYVCLAQCIPVAMFVSFSVYQSLCSVQFSSSQDGRVGAGS